MRHTALQVLPYYTPGQAAPAIRSGHGDQARNRPQVFLLLLGMCLLFGACGHRSAGIRLRIPTVGPGLQTYCMPITLAESLGYYKDEGLDVQLDYLSSNARTLESLVGGSADVALVHYQHTVQMAAQGEHVRSFFVLNQRDSKVLAVAPAAEGHIHRVEDLKGQAIGIPSPGSSTQEWLNYILKRHGVSPSEVSTFNIGGGAPAIAAIESGRIAAAGLIGGDHLQLLQRHPGLRILVDAGTPEGMRESYGDLYAGGTVAAKEQWLVRNADTARRIVRALQRTLAWIATHKPEEIRDRLPDSSRSPDARLDVEIIRWGRGVYTADGRMLDGAPESMKRFLDATMEKVRDSKIDLASTWTNEYLPEAK